MISLCFNVTVMLAPSCWHWHRGTFSSALLQACLLAALRGCLGKWMPGRRSQYHSSPRCYLYVNLRYHFFFLPLKVEKHFQFQFNGCSLWITWGNERGRPALSCWNEASLSCCSTELSQISTGDAVNVEQSKHQHHAAYPVDGNHKILITRCRSELSSPHMEQGT